MDQGREDAADASDIDKMLARFAYFDAAERRLTDLERSTDEVTERHAPGDDVAPSDPWRQVEAVVTPQSLQNFRLDKRYLA